MPDDDSSPITRRDSGSLAVFEKTATEALAKLESMGPDYRGQTLMHEARELLQVLAFWRKRPPLTSERTECVQRVIDLHRNVEEYLATRRQ